MSKKKVAGLLLLCGFVGFVFRTAYRVGKLEESVEVLVPECPTASRKHTDEDASLKNENDDTGNVDRIATSPDASAKVSKVAAETYGKGSPTLYGHVKTSNTYNSTSSGASAKLSEVADRTYQSFTNRVVKLLHKMDSRISALENIADRTTDKEAETNVDGTVGSEGTE